MHGGEINMYHNTLFLASAVDDELLGRAPGLCNHIFDLHAMLPKLECGPVSSLVPREQNAVCGDAIVGKNNKATVVSYFVDVGALCHLNPRETAVTRHHHIGFISPVVKMVAVVADGDDDADSGRAGVEGRDAWQATDASEPGGDNQNKIEYAAGACANAHPLSKTTCREGADCNRLSLRIRAIYNRRVTGGHADQMTQIQDVCRERHF
jgi:hypothetical protein